MGRTKALLSGLAAIITILTSLEAGVTLAATSHYSQKQEAMAPARPKDEPARRGFWDRLFGRNKPESQTSSGSIQTATVNWDVRKPHFLNAAYIDKQFAGTKLAGKGKLIIALAKQKGIDPAFMISIIALETGWGKRSSPLKYRNNPGGLGGGGMSFKTVDEGLAYMAEHLQERYISRGDVTIAQIGKVYCPPGARNDSGGNRRWPAAVTKLMNQLVQGSMI